MQQLAVLMHSGLWACEYVQCKTKDAVGLSWMCFDLKAM